MTVTTIEQASEEVIVEAPSPITSSTPCTAPATTKVDEQEELKIVRRIVDALSEDEQEHAARTSYKYFLESQLFDTATQQTRIDYACKMARRHLIAEKGKEHKALQKLQATIQWRRETNMDDLRKCFDQRFIGRADEDTKNLYQELREGLKDQMEAGKCYARGYDQSGRAIHLSNMHNYTNFDAKYYHAFHFYMVDRAMAATERATDGRETKLTVVMDYSRYGLKNNVPLGLAKTFLSIFSNHFPEVLQDAFLLDAPFLFRAFWTMIKPFVDSDIKRKLKFVTGDAAKQEIVSQYISEDQASPCMLSDAKSTRPFDKDEFFDTIPYDHIFDER
jgi:hypothetical protein